jgi:PAS domain-containing protein
MTLNTHGSLSRNRVRRMVFAPGVKEKGNAGSHARNGATDALRYILEGTAGETGPEFFDALVKRLAQALGVAGAWVTQWVEARRRLRALSFYFEGGYIPDFEYDVRGTPCERVMEEARLIHFPERVVEVFPDDRDLRNCRAVGYVGIPLFDVDGAILGNLAALHTAKLPMDTTIESLFRIFAARATAEVRRLRAEADLRDREQRLSLLVATALDAIIELDGNLGVMNANPSAAAAFGCHPEHMIGRVSAVA